MKLTANKDKSLDDDYIDVKYRELTPAIQQIFQIAESDSFHLLAEKEEATHRVDVHDILYIEHVDNKCFLYTEEEVYHMGVTLSQLENSLKDWDFIRISKMALVNTYKIKSISSGLNYRLTAVMVNGEKVTISRHYRGKLLDAIHALAKEIRK